MTNDENGYNGWTNYATWNVGLWIDNEYDAYMTKVDYLKRLNRTVDKHDVITVLDMTFGKMTPDLVGNDWEGGRIQDVNWWEIAESWEQERLELTE